MTQPEFDRFARSYEQDLAKSLAVTGDGREFYAQKRIDWTAQCLGRLGVSCERVLDYGCGDGANVPMLAERLGAQYTLGVDISTESIVIARREYAAQGLQFLNLNDWTPDASFDLVFTNGVFHHIPPAERRSSLESVYSALRPGRWFAFWENNPWNPGTRYVMSRCAFDENAIKINPREAKKMLADAGFKVVRSNSLFYFPRQLSFLRPAESWLRGLPLGGQYLVLCRKNN